SGDEVGRGAGALGEELHPPFRPPYFRILLLRLQPTHGRAEGERRHLLGREHARRRAFAGDDDLDRARASTSKVTRVNTLRVRFGWRITVGVNLAVKRTAREVVT